MCRVLFVVAVSDGRDGRGRVAARGAGAAEHGAATGRLAAGARAAAALHHRQHPGAAPAAAAAAAAAASLHALALP